MVFLDIIFIPLVIFSGHLIINRVCDVHGLQKQRGFLTSLFYYHLAMGVAFGLYITFFGGDSLGYWKPPDRFIRNDNWLSLHQTGTPFIFFLTYPFSQVLGLSFWSGTILFALVGFGGFVSIYLTLLRTLQANPRLFGYKLFPAVLFLPNMHFWSGGVGKDSVIFFALALFIFSMTNVKGNIPGLVISFYLAFFIRPHIAFVMLAGFGMALVLSSSGISVFWRVTFLMVCVIVFVLISSTVFQFIGLDEENIENYEDVANIRSQNLSRRTVGSAIDISSYPIPLKMLTFLYRPLFFDAGNIFGLVVSFENLFYVLLTLAAFRLSSLREIYRMPLFIKACLFISMATTFFMSSSLSNLGIIIRQKNMVMFMLMLVLLYLMSRIQYKRISSARRPTIKHVKIKTA